MSATPPRPTCDVKDAYRARNTHDNVVKCPAVKVVGMTPPTDTHCPYCSLQCGMRLAADPVEVLERPGFPVNRGALCGKGQSAAALLDPAARLTVPLVRDRRGTRRSGELRSASWDEALDRVAAGFTAIRAEYGADAVGVFGGGGLTNEKAYQLGKFARVALGTANIDYNGRFCMSSAAAANRIAFGLDRGCPSHWRTSRAPSALSWSAATRPRRCRPRCATSANCGRTAAR